MSVIMALLMFGFLVFFHELGHFLLAKKNGIRVNEFAIGMGPKLASFKRGDTIYCIKILPLGGSCMMAGEDEASDDINAFNNKSVWARMSVVLAGPVFNFILAFVMAVVVIGTVGFDKPQIVGVMDGYPAQEAGFMEGDVIREINQKKIMLYREVMLYLTIHAGEPLTVTVDRRGEEFTSTIVPKLSEDGKNYYMGIYVSSLRTRTSPLETLKYSFYEVKYQISTVIESLGLLFKGKVTVNDLSGPVGIVNMVNEVVEESTSAEVDFKTNVISVLLNVINFAIMLSANLGVMNLLPIPGLDGGRMVFLIIEAVRGKAIDREKEGMVHLVGLVLLMALMAVVMFNDFRKIF